MGTGPAAARVSIYDEVAFPSYPYAASHPDRLATMARLCGFPAADPARCRVLEVGCGAGGNLLPMADSLPHSQFVGIDLSPQQIELAERLRSAAGLNHVRMETRDLLQVDATLGPFDYLIAHGVFSWTPSAVQDKLLNLCRELLAPHGVAYLNYNTYPGWHVQGMLRDMLLFHAEPQTDPAERVRAARQMIAFLQQRLPDPSTPFGSVVRTELEHIQQSSDGFLFHAYLNVRNQPLYVSDLQRRGAAAGLAYLGDAEPELCWPQWITPQVAAGISALASDPHRAPQYYDFIRFTSSRRSLLVPAAASDEPETPAGGSPGGEPRWDRWDDLHASGNLKWTGGEPPARPATFAASGGRTISTNDGPLAATLQMLAEAWPQSLPVPELSERSFATASAPVTDSVRQRWRQDLLQAFGNHVLTLSVRPSIALREIPERPRSSRLMRVQAAEQDFVTNRRHEAIRLGEPERHFLQRLDGTRTVEHLRKEFGRDPIETLQRLARQALLVPATDP